MYDVREGFFFRVITKKVISNVHFWRWDSGDGGCGLDGGRANRDPGVIGTTDGIGDAAESDGGSPCTVGIRTDSLCARLTTR